MQQFALYVLSIAVLLPLLLYRRRQVNLPLPPGPKPLPIFGNFLNIPDYYTYAEWAKVYGDVIHMKAFWRHMIVVNSAEAARDLIDKRSSIYSDRPRMPMVNELMGWDWAFVFMPYGTRWRQRRKLFHEYFSGEAASKHVQLQTRGVHRLLHDLLDTPEDFARHIRYMFVATTVRAVYGVEIFSKDDPFVDVSQNAIGGVSEASIAGWLVDIIPILKYIPEWFPGAVFKRKAREWHDLQSAFVNRPFHDAVSALSSDSIAPSVVRCALEKLNAKGGDDMIDETLIKHVAGNVLLAGSDSTVSVILIFILAMVLHPEVQQKAQAELDILLRSKRLPTYDDLGALPYIEAIATEVLRWQVTLPLGIPHRVTRDDVYRGYRIPKGTVVLVNAWAILHDEKLFPDHSAFRPERYLHEDGSYNKDAVGSDAAFGFGRRVCPGKQMALNVTRITIASILSVFTVERATDALGHGIPVKPEMILTGMAFPKPFRCRFRPRSETMEALVRQTIEDCSPVL